MVNNAATSFIQPDSTVQRNILKRKVFCISSLMGRKRSKPNPPTQNDGGNEATVSSQPATTNKSLQPDSTQSSSDESTLQKQRSWYGTWPRIYKSPASTEVARESIMAGKPTNTSSADLSKLEPRRADKPVLAASRPASMYLGKSKETSGVTLSDEAMDADKKAESGEDPVASDDNVISASTDSQDDSTAPSGLISYIPIVGSWRSRAKQPEATPTQIQENSDNTLTSSDQPSNPSVPGQKNLSYSTDKTPKPSAPEQKNISNGSEDSSSWRPWLWASSSNTTVAVDTSADQPSAESSEESSAAAVVDSDPNASKGTGSSRQWFSVFSLTSDNTTEDGSKDSQPLLNSTEESSKSDDIPDDDTPKFRDGSKPVPGSSWAFFGGKKSYESGSQMSGKLAVIGDKSQSNAQPATIEKSPRRTKSGRSSPNNVGTASSAGIIKTPNQLWPFEQENKAHFLLPALRETYKMMEDPSIIQQLARLVRLSREPPAEHVSLVKEPPKIKKAVVIGVHGLAMIERVVGSMLGTSELFANHAAAAVARWTRRQGYKCEICPILLEYKGKVEERVNELWKTLLRNSIADLQNADLVIFACHSQGVPVSTMLAAKLVSLGIITSNSTRIGICALAGVNMGPFPSYRNAFTRTTLGNSTGWELFDFVDSESMLSKAYAEALRTFLRFGGKVTYIGSLDDGLVPMESSTFIAVHHPNIYRAVFVDGRNYKYDFIVKLIAFALKLRNLGLRDHGLIRELSGAVGGPSTGQGHSILYDDPKTYDLAIQHTLETTSVRDVDLTVRPYNPATKPDPYFLPFVTRGVLDEGLARTELSHEAMELLKQYDDWQPTGGPLIEVKTKLRALKSML